MANLDTRELSKQYAAKLKKIKIALFDVDGILSDGKLYYSGEEVGYNRFFHTHDGYGLKILMRAGLKVGIITLKKILALPISERMNYKLQNEYRILNSNNTYIRIIEQFKPLELDTKGNFWLALSIMDISPNQDNYEGIRSQIINVTTGKFEAITAKEAHPLNDLSKREIEILSHIKEGFLSKEISSKLAISVHTVNTHRQNILKKLGANNSFEAIEFAKSFI